MKKRLILLSAALLVALYAFSAFAANVTGKWTAEDKDPDRKSTRLNSSH